MSSIAKVGTARRFIGGTHPARKSVQGELVQARTEIQKLRAQLRRTEKERDIFLNQAAAFFAGQLE